MPAAALKIVDHAPQLSRTEELGLMVGSQVSLPQRHEQEKDGHHTLPLSRVGIGCWRKGIPHLLPREGPGRADPGSWEWVSWTCPSLVVALKKAGSVSWLVRGRVQLNHPKGKRLESWSHDSSDSSLSAPVTCCSQES